MPESDDPSSDPPPPKSATDPKSTDPKSAADPKSATDHKGIDQKLKSAKHKLEAVQIFDMLGMRSDKVDDPAVEVFGSIFISGFEAAQSKKLIQKEKIKVVVSLGDFSKDDTEKLGIDRHEVIHIQDDKSVDIVKHLDTGIKWIEEALKDKKKVLVHCEAGISRSVTLVTAYAMKNLFRGQPVDKPLEKIREKRLKAEPNSSFRAQLDLYEDMGLKFDSSNSTYKKFLIDIEVLFGGSFKTDDLGKDPESSKPGEPEKNAEEYLIRCKNCKRGLAKEENATIHFKEEDKEAAQEETKIEVATPATGKTPQAAGKVQATGKAPVKSRSRIISSDCNQYHVQAMAWMWGSDAFLGGHITCPKCQEILGERSKEGILCDCGRWTLPGFHLNKDAVDEGIRRDAQKDYENETQDRAKREDEKKKKKEAADVKKKKEEEEAEAVEAKEEAKEAKTKPKAKKRQNTKP